MYEPENQQENRFINFDPKSAKTKKKKENLSHGKANFEEFDGESFPTKSAHLEIENFLRPSEMKLLELSKEKSTRCCECNSKEFSLQEEVLIECLNCKGNTQTHGKKKVQETHNSTKATLSSKFPLTSQEKKKKKNEIWEVAPIPSESFQKEHPELCKNGNIYFPIEDQLFNEYENSIQPYLASPSEYQMKELPTHFEYVLDVWNLLQTFPEYFCPQKLVLNLSEIESLLLDDTQILNLVSRILDVFVQDLISDKNEMMKKSKHFDLFSLIKFCAENGFLMKIYEKCWPTLAIAFFEYFPGHQSNLENSDIIAILQSIAHKYFGQFPKNIFIRAKIVSELTKILAECNEFRRIVQEKGDCEKKQSKKWLELEEKKKKLSKALSKQTEQEKSYKKEFKALSKQKNGQNSENLESPEKYENSQEKLFEVENIRTLKAETTLKLDEVEEELLNFEKSKNKVTHVELLGMDKNHSYYWVNQEFIENFISGFDGIVVDCAGKWFSLERQAIKGFLGNLNLRGIRENQLYQALNSFLETQKQSPSETMPIKLHHNLSFSVDTEISEGTAHSLFSYLESLLIDSESRIVSYLEERNSRWGSEKEREEFVLLLLFSSCL